MKIVLIPLSTRLSLVATLILAGAAPAFSRGSFNPTGVLDMLPTSMSDDAKIVVGIGVFGTPNLYYTELTGASIIGAGCSSGVPAISGDGTTVLGCNTDVNGKWNAAKWLGGHNWQDLGSVPGAVSCDAFLSGSYGVTQDGSLGVGLLYGMKLCKANAGTWDVPAGGPGVYLPAEFGDTTYSRANAVNADGSVIIGWQDQMDGERVAAKWVNGVEEIILSSGGEFNGEALAVSADGQSIVGTGYNYGPQAWIWRPDTGVLPIYAIKGMSAVDTGGVTSPAGHGSLTATDVSDDGRIVIGYALAGFSTRAIIWLNNGKGAFYLDEFLRKLKVKIPAGWTLNSASIISPDGNTIYGWGINPNGKVEMFKVSLN